MSPIRGDAERQVANLGGRGAKVNLRGGVIKAWLEVRSDGRKRRVERVDKARLSESKIRRKEGGTSRIALIYAGTRRESLLFHRSMGADIWKKIWSGETDGSVCRMFEKERGVSAC